MKAIILRIEKKPSNYGGQVYLIETKELTGQGNFFTWIHKSNRNYARWCPIIKAVEDGYEVILDHLKLYENKQGKKIIDADSDFTCFKKKIQVLTTDKEG